MILSASRRCDIPACFSEWLCNRIKEGYACVRNPFNPRQVSRIDLSPDVVDCIVFWSKNPGPLLTRLDRLQDYMYYFQFTLNAYGKEIEANLPDLNERIHTFRTLSERVGKERVIWRYDPVILTADVTLSWHEAQFSHIAEKLSGFTETCIFSFVDLYSKISRAASTLGIRPLTAAEKNETAQILSAIARSHGLKLNTCTETAELSAWGIGHARCIDPFLIARLLDCRINWEKDKNQRSGCGCASAVDLGIYDACPQGCAYCYACRSPEVCRRTLSSYDPASPLLCSSLTEADHVTKRNIKSLKDCQLCFEDL